MPRIAPDDFDVIVWRLNEGNSGPPFVNSSTSPRSKGSAANLVTVTGTIVKDDLSIFQEDSSVRFPSFGSYPTGASATYNRLQTAGGLSSLRTPAPVSVSGWVRVRSWANLGDNYGFVLKKVYRNDETWSPPYVSVDFTVWNTANGTMRFEVTTGGGPTLRPILSHVADGRVPQGLWSHVGLTFDRQVLKAYVNGRNVGSLILSSPEDIAWGTDGVWAFGAATLGDGNKQEGAVNVADWRIADTIRDLAYFRRIYRAGVLSW